MTTLRQLVMKFKRVENKWKSKVPALEKCPFKIGLVRKRLPINYDKKLKFVSLFFSIKQYKNIWHIRLKNITLL